MAEAPYKAEYAKSGRATCAGPCSSPIAQGELRLGSPVGFGDAVSYKWRHWACITEKVLSNIRAKVEEHGLDAALAGLNELRPEDQQRVRRWLEEGPSDDDEKEVVAKAKPEAAAVPAVKTPRKRAPSKKAVEAKEAEAELEEEDEEYSPRPKRKSTKQARK
ncbi:hypothetical protein ABPG75_005698 [Micractinium tetrahymenae]